MTWNLDDIVLTIGGMAEIADGRPRADVLAELAAETGRPLAAVEAAVMAVGVPTMRADALRLLLTPLDGVALLDNRRLLNHLVRAAREARARRP